MKSLIKFLGLAAVIVIAGLWIMTVSKSCNKNKLATVPKLETGVTDRVTEVRDDVESLFEGETEEEGLFNEEGDEVTANGRETRAEVDLLGEGEGDEDEYEDDEDDEDDEEDLANLKDEIAARTNAVKSAASSTAAAATTQRTSSYSGTEYFVIGGAFLTEANANAEVKRLRKKGYDEAEVVTFDYSQYHSVCVQKTGSISSARATKNKLIKGGNPEAYVHKKRSKKKRK